MHCIECSAVRQRGRLRRLSNLTADSVRVNNDAWLSQFRSLSFGFRIVGGLICLSISPVLTDYRIIETDFQLRSSDLGGRLLFHCFVLFGYLPFVLGNVCLSC